MSSTMHDQDVIELLLDQHTQIKNLFHRISTATGEEKRRLFQELTRLLAVHESAEEQVVHPIARTMAGDSVVDARLREEDEAKHTLAELYRLGPDSDEFDAKMTMFAADVIDHATHEEQQEFLALRAKQSPERLRKMAGAVRAAEAMAPTRPHPSTGESPTANMLAGPPLALFDRARDAVRNWRSNGDNYAD